MNTFEVYWNIRTFSIREGSLNPSSDTIYYGSESDCKNVAKQLRRKLEELEREIDYREMGAHSEQIN